MKYLFLIVSWCWFSFAAVNAISAGVAYARGEFDRQTAIMQFVAISLAAAGGELFRELWKIEATK